MPERPLVLFAAPTVADKERRYGGAPKYYFPSHSPQVSSKILKDEKETGCNRKTG